MLSLNPPTTAIDDAALDEMEHEQLLDFILSAYLESCIVPSLPHETHDQEILKRHLLYRFHRKDPFLIQLQKMSDDELIDYLERTYIDNWNFIGERSDFETVKHELQRRLKLSA